MILAMLITFGVMMLVAALVALYSRDIVTAIVASGVVSLLASVLYVLFGAPERKNAAAV